MIQMGELSRCSMKMFVYTILSIQVIISWDFRGEVERGILGLDLISAQAWRGTQTHFQNSSAGGVPKGQNMKKTRKLP